MITIELVVKKHGKVTHIYGFEWFIHSSLILKQMKKKLEE